MKYITHISFILFIFLFVLVLIVLPSSIKEISAINWSNIAKKLLENAIVESFDIGIDIGQSIQEYDHQESQRLQEYYSQQAKILSDLPSSIEQLLLVNEQQKKLLQEKLYASSFIPYNLMNIYNNSCYESNNSPNNNNNNNNIPLPLSDDSSELYRQGVFLIENGRCAESLAYFDKSIEIDPTRADAWYEKGRVLYLMERYNEAVEANNKSLSLDSNDSEAWNSRGTILTS